MASPYDGAVAVISKLLRAGEGRIVRHLSAIAEQIEKLEDDYVDMTDEELRAQTDEFRARLEDGETLDHILPDDWRDRDVDG